MCVRIWWVCEGGYAYATARMWKSEDSFGESVLFCYNRFKRPSFHSKPFDPLNQLTAAAFSSYEVLLFSQTGKNKL